MKQAQGETWPQFQARRRAAQEVAKAPLAPARKRRRKAPEWRAIDPLDERDNLGESPDY